MKNKYKMILSFLIITVLLFFVTSLPNDIEIPDEHIPLGIDKVDNRQEQSGTNNVDTSDEPESSSTIHLEKRIPISINKNGEQQISIADFGAVGDGFNDDTEQIQNAINYANINSISNIVIPDGHYMVRLDKLVGGKFGRYTAISLYSNINIEMQEDAIIEAIPTDKPNYAIFNIVDCDSVKINGGTIIGERNGHLDVLGEHGMGINIFKSTTVSISNVNIKDCL